MNSLIELRHYFFPEGYINFLKGAVADGKDIEDFLVWMSVIPVVTEVNLQIIYDVKSTTTKDLQIIHDVKVTTEKNLQIIYDVKTSVEKDLQIIYDVKVTTTKDLQIIHDVKQTTTKDLQLIYDVLVVAGSAPVVTHSASGGGGLVTTASVVIPAGAAVGQYLLVGCAWRADKNFSSLTGLTNNPTIIGSELVQGAGLTTGIDARIFSKIIETGDPGDTLVLTCSDTANPQIVVAVIDGEHGTPIQDTIVTSTGASATSFAASGVTTTIANTLLVIIACTNNGTAGDAPHIAPPASMAEVTEAPSTARVGISLNTETIAGTGATGTRTFTAEETGTWACFAIPIAPA